MEIFLYDEGRQLRTDYVFNYLHGGKLSLGFFFTEVLHGKKLVGYKNLL